MSGVKVAVRVRPFNSRELARDAESIITSEIIIMTVIIMMIMMMLRIMPMTRVTMILPDMHSSSSSYYCHTHNNDIPVEGATTRIKNPKAGNATDAIKSFNFDYSYWSKEVSGSTEPFAFLTSTPKDEKKCIILQVAGQHTYAFLCIFNIHGPRRHGNGYWCIPMPPWRAAYADFCYSREVWLWILHHGRIIYMILLLKICRINFSSGV